MFSLLRQNVGDEETEDEDSEHEPVQLGVLTMAMLKSNNRVEEHGLYEEFVPFDSSVWGVTILTIVRDLVHVFCKKPTTVRCLRSLFGVVLWMVNLWLQLGSLYFVNYFIVGESVHATQDNYMLFHEQMYDGDGSFQSDKWDDWPGPKKDLCNLAVTQVGFTVMVLFIWTSRMIEEARNIQRLMSDINKIQNLPADADMTDMLHKKKDEDGGDPEWHLVALNCPARTMIYVLVIIPKWFVALSLLYVGSEWLCATQSFSALILNALALGFIIDIDEMVFSVFAPQLLKKWTDAAKYCHIKFLEVEDLTPEKDREKEEIVAAYGRSFVYLILCFSWAICYLKFFQQVIPGFSNDLQSHCIAVYREQFTPSCLFKIGDPFGSGANDRCFPFGSAPTPAPET